jgi:peptidoglycan/LPS O-acetylase OafA/YrhL
VTRVRTLDGLRALAVLMVLATHSVADLPLGGIGVSIFFVLSGYLITILLVREQEKVGRISLGLFYLRRVARLYPALVAMLLLTVALGAPVESALIAGTYTTNLFNSFGIGDFPYGHTWSLGMEEQFYLLWPLLLPFVLRRGTWPRVLLALLALASAGAGWAFVVTTHGTAGVHGFNPLFRALGLIVGCLLALHLHRRSIPFRPGVLVGVGLALVIASIAVAEIGNASPAAFGWNALTPVLGGAALIAGLVSGGTPGVNRILGSAPAVWMGKRSYAIYLWHVPLIELGRLRGLSASAAALVGVSATIMLSEASYRWVERPFLRLKDRLHPRGQRSPAGDHQPNDFSVAA